MTDLEKFLKDNPPEKIPYRDGARYTTGFGLRESAAVLEDGGSPLHLGVDRGSRPPIIRQPWDGTFNYQVVGGVAGSVLRSYPQSFKMELQCFHSHKATVLRENTFAERGFHLANAGDLGFSHGIHTHTEILFPFDEELYHWLKNNYPSEQIAVRDEHGVKMNTDLIGDHCERYGLDCHLIFRRIPEQMVEWDILEVRTNFAIRRSMPMYRIPHWGHGTTIHVSSKELFQI